MRVGSTSTRALRILLASRTVRIAEPSYASADPYTPLRSDEPRKLSRAELDPVSPRDYRKEQPNSSRAAGRYKRLRLT